MGWVRVDDSFYDHGKFAEVGPLGLAAWISGLAYANRNLTDGFIPSRTARRIIDCDGLGVYTSGMGGRDADAMDGVADLVGAGLWEEVDGGYQIHDYLDFQPSAEKVREERRKAAERQAAAREVRAAKKPPKKSRRSHGSSHVVSHGGGSDVTSPGSPLAPNPNPRDSSNEESPASIVPKNQLAVVPEPSPPTAAERAKPLTSAFWERQNPKPAVKFIALTKIVERFLEAGWSEEAVSRALDETRAYTVDAITYSLNHRKNGAEQAKPKSFDLLQRRMAKHQAAEAGA